MPRFALYQNQLTTFDPAKTAYSSNPTAYIEAENLERVFAIAQHAETPWFTHPAVTLCVRSMSVSDKLVDENDMSHVVAALGFEPPREPLPIELVLANLQTMIEQRKVDAMWLPVLVEAYDLIQGANACPF